MTCIDALAGRREELRRALGGRSLLVLIAYDDGDELRVMLTRSGLVSIVPAAEPFDPDVELRGSAREVDSFLAGRTGLGEAILSGNVRLHIAEDDAASYGELRRVVADVVGSSAGG